MFLDNAGLSFKPEDLEAIFRVASIRYYPAGATIFNLGDEGRDMFYIADGEVSLTLADGEIKRVSQGQFFGEFAFILPNFRRTATAKAQTDCQLICLEQSVYDVLIQENPRLLCIFLHSTCAYLLASEQRLTASLTQKNHELERTLDYLRKTREELDYKEIMAQTDELTGLFNRRGLNAFMEKLTGQARTLGISLGLIMLDLDNFKKINDTWGHHYGDEVLQKVADILQTHTRHSDMVCRPGGDEFVILLPGLTAERGLTLSESIRKQIDEDFAEDSAGIKLTGSLGLAFFEQGDSVADLLLRADRNLYLAKDQGRNRVGFNLP
jgi:diguanylate cyclase (GGDEF)-like protein